MEAQAALETAVLYERRKVWLKATKNYEKVLRLIPKIQVTPHVNTARLQLLIYECHYHCGVAYQQMQDYQKALTHFTRAIRVVSTRKDACPAGCISGRALHLHVPVLVRISMCQIHHGEVEEALKTIEEAIILDFNNPDLFCARALVHFLLDNKEKATTDATFAIKLNSCQVSAWLLRGLFKKFQEESFRLDGRNSKLNRDILKACDIDANAMVFLNIKNFQDHFQDLFDRLLPSIRLSHTLCVKDVLDLDIRDLSSTRRLSERRALTCKDLNKKLEARLKEAKRKSFVCSAAPIERTHSAPCEVSWNRTRSVGSSISHPTRGQLASSHYQMAHAQRNEPLVSRSASHVPVTLGDVLKARGSGNYTRGEFRCLANSLEEEKNGRTLKDGRRTGERMYSKRWQQDRIPTGIPDIRGCRKLP